MDTDTDENFYDTIPDTITPSPAENDAHRQHIYVQVSIPDINMKVNLSRLCFVQTECFVLSSSVAVWPDINRVVQR